MLNVAKREIKKIFSGTVKYEQSDISFNILRDILFEMYYYNSQSFVPNTQIRCKQKYSLIS